MNKLKCKIEKKAAFHTIGVKKTLTTDMEQNLNEIPLFWQQVNLDSTLEKLIPLMNQEPKGVLGISVGFEPSTDFSNKQETAYYIAVASSQKKPENLIAYTVPALTWAIFTGEGTMPDAIQDLQKQITANWLPSSGYTYTNGPNIERYLDFTPTNTTFEVWLPITKK